MIMKYAAQFLIRAGGVGRARFGGRRDGELANGRRAGGGGRRGASEVRWPAGTVNSRTGGVGPASFGGRRGR